MQSSQSKKRKVIQTPKTKRVLEGLSGAGITEEEAVKKGLLDKSAIIAKVEPVKNVDVGRNIARAIAASKKTPFSAKDTTGAAQQSIDVYKRIKEMEEERKKKGAKK